MIPQLQYRLVSAHRTSVRYKNTSCKTYRNKSLRKKHPNALCRVADLVKLNRKSLTVSQTIILLFTRHPALRYAPRRNGTLKIIISS